MPISDKHNLIFVHIPKTAGTSIEHSLKIHGHRNKGRLEPPCLKLLFGLHEGRYLQHLTMPEIQEHLRADQKTYFSFAFVRNPYDRIASAFNWRRKIGALPKEVSFLSFLTDHVAQNKGNRTRASIIFEEQAEFIAADDGTILVDFVGRFERLQEDFDRFTQLCGLRLSLPRKNVSRQSQPEKLYDQQTQQIVEELYRRDLDLFQYSFRGN